MVRFLVIAMATAALAAGAANASTLSPICGDCQLVRFAHCEGVLEGPVFDASGTLLVAAPTKAAMYRIAADGTCALATQMPHVDAMPTTWRYLPDGSVLGLDASYGPFTVSKRGDPIIYTGRHIVRGGFPDSNFKGMDDLALDKDGGAYITDALGSSVLIPNGQLFYRAPTGEITLLVSGNLAFPNGIAVSPDGKTLYVGEWNAARIIAIPINAPGRIDISRAYVFAYSPSGRGPDGMTLDDAGNLYVADWGGGGSVVVYAPDGTRLASIVAPGEQIEATNVALHAGYLYVTTAQGNIWRVAVKAAELKRW